MQAASIIRRFIGRDLTWRLGRALYLAAREESTNLITANGEQETVRVAYGLHKRLHGEQTFIAFDIGANLGHWTEALFRVVGLDANVRVEMFEPVPAMIAHLGKVFAAEPRAVLNGMAISDREGTAEMAVAGVTAGASSLDPRQEHRGDRVSVRLTTLAAELDRLGLDEVPLIKMDAEGHDIVVLRGVRSLLDRQSVGLLQFEYNHLWLVNRGSLKEVFELAAGTDYSVAKITPSGPAVFEAWHPELDRYFEANYALVRNRVAEEAGLRRLRWSDANVALG
jgi:FkbM family methyltransferase